MKKKDEMIAFIKYQINVEITPSRVDKKRKVISFDDNLKGDEMCRLKSLSALSKKFDIVPNGYKTLAIIIL